MIVFLGITFGETIKTHSLPPMVESICHIYIPMWAFALPRFPPLFLLLSSVSYTPNLIQVFCVVDRKIPRLEEALWNFSGRGVAAGIVI